MLDDLPDELLDIVCSKLNATTLARLECTSARMRDAARRAPLEVHAAPRTLDRVLRWATDPARAGRVTRVSLRRVRVPPEVWTAFPRVVAVRALYCRVPLPIPINKGSIRSLHLGRLTRSPGDPAAFRTSRLPRVDSLCLTFDGSWARVIVDRPAPRLELRGAAVVRLETLDGVEDLVVSTRHLEISPGTAAPRCRTARLEADAATDAEPLLALFGPALETLVLGTPLADVSWPFADLDPAVLALDADFALLRRVNPALRFLEVRADRLAAARVPPEVEVWAEVRGAQVDRSFFL